MEKKMENEMEIRECIGIIRGFIGIIIGLLIIIGLHYFVAQRALPSHSPKLPSSGTHLSRFFWWLNPVRLYSLLKILYPKGG